ncbi:MAG: oxidoreductase [Burkholderiales bacterium]|nr:oxidoreductase [Burkholderiales bacterium]
MALWFDLRVVGKARIASEVWQFELAGEAGVPLPAFAAGAHVTVITPLGQRRNYSLCGAPQDRSRYVLAIKREARGRGGSVCLVDDVAVGTTLRVSEPRNHFALSPRARSFIFIAGGIGITPIYAMMQQLRASGNEDFSLVYCSRDRASAAFADQLEAEFGGKVHLHHDGGHPAQAYDFWPLLERPTAAHVYCCGPTALMECVADMSGHWPTGAVHFERFGVSYAARAADEPFVARLRQTDVSVQVGAQESLLDALRRAGVAIRSSCESGVCGACKTRLIAGDVAHRDQVLSDAERAQHIMVCVSRASGAGCELVLDL